MKTGEKEHDYKNLKDLDYRVAKTKEEEKEEEAKKDKADEADQELPPWIKSKDKFNELKNYTLSIKDNKLKTDKKEHQYDFSDMKELVKIIANNKITKNDQIKDLKENNHYVGGIKK